MTLEDFWNLVERVHKNAAGDMDAKCQLLDRELRGLTLQEVQSFHARFDECYDRAYDYNLWAAAYIIGGGCSDDAFSDFRSTLISMGRQTFERTLKNPEYLADIDYDEDVAHYEGYQYVPTKVEADLGGGLSSPRSRAHPDDPTGEPWNEDREVAIRYPKLAKKYNYLFERPKPWWKFW
ncbi:MAG: hypothetical protein JWM68_4390 [Verrucomicrobiales bacterium]|nr:hypothetical protein [Verrucomicrobiales bacterium]